MVLPNEKKAHFYPIPILFTAETDCPDQEYHPGPPIRTRQLSRTQGPESHMARVKELEQMSSRYYFPENALAWERTQHFICYSNPRISGRTPFPSIVCVSHQNQRPNIS